MTKRDKNIRKSCDEINQQLVNMENAINKQESFDLSSFVKTIYILTHRIKRTTWRGEKKDDLSRIMGRCDEIADDYNKIKYIKDPDGETTEHAPATDW